MVGTRPRMDDSRIVYTCAPWHRTSGRCARIAGVREKLVLTARQGVSKGSWMVFVRDWRP
jgi:hypothetical protein